MEQTLIQNYATSLIRGLIEKSDSIKKIKHKSLKGQLRELFISEILESFLTNQFDIGSGTIINQKGDESNQTDIIIYDNRILPPFIQQQSLGVYPAESVIATIEIKSNLTKNEILKSESDAKILKEQIYNPMSSTSRDYEIFKPICAILGFYGSGVNQLKNLKEGKSWLRNNIEFLTFIGLINKYSWIKMAATSWTGKLSDETNNETKRFIGVLLDNVRTYADKRWRLLLDKHNDWLGIYIRDQGLFK
jgi:hypothetical protein